MDIALELKVISKFIRQNKHGRYLDFIKTDKTRKKFIREISSVQVFHRDLFENIDGSEAETIRRVSKKLGINDCYIISENTKIDGQRFGIDQALTEAISPWSDTTTLIVFGDAQVVYREHDGLNNKWISKIK